MYGGGGGGGAGIAQWLERRTRDWKVAGSNPCWNGGRIFFSRVDFLCWLLFRYPFHPRVTTVARKKSRSFCQKCRWQVTAKTRIHLTYVAFIEPCFGIGHNLSLICQMTSEDIKHHLIVGNVHKPQPFWRERRAEAVLNRGPSAYQPNALPLGQTGSRMRNNYNYIIYINRKLAQQWYCKGGNKRKPWCELDDLLYPFMEAFAR